MKDITSCVGPLIAMFFRAMFYVSAFWLFGKARVPWLGNLMAWSHASPLP